MEGTFDPEEGQEGRIQRTILLWMRTFHPKEALVHMEEGWMLAEEGLFHPEEPSFLLWMAMMLPKDGTFLPGVGLVLVEEGSMLPEEGLFHPDQPSFLLRSGTMLLYERLVLPEVGSVHSVYRRDAVLGVRGATLLYRKLLLYRRVLRRPRTASFRTNAAEELLYQRLTGPNFSLGIVPCKPVEVGVISPTSACGESL
ncbi:hypothetical protein ACXR0O_04045 [Verrucomicrobiota bacterium sgz303538]